MSDSARSLSGADASAGVAADELAGGEDVSLEGVKELRFGCAGRQGERGVEGVEVEDVPVRGAGGRAGSAVADTAEVVAALKGAGGELRLGGEGFGEGAGVWRQIPEEPVGEGAHGGVGVGDEEGEAAGGRGRRVPCERGGEVGLTRAGGVARGDGCGEAGAGEVQVGIILRGQGSAVAGGDGEEREEQGRPAVSAARRHRG